MNDTNPQVRNRLIRFLFDKRIEIILVLGLIILIFLLFFLLYYLAMRNQSTKREDRPSFLFEITKGKNELKIPLGVAVSDNRIYVADSGNGQVVVFNSQGRYLFSFNVSKGKGKGASYPAGIALDNSGKVYVSDLQGSVIKVFTANGYYLKNFPSTDSLIRRPLGITYARSKIYVTDIGDQTVKIFNLKGDLVDRFGQPGKGKGQLAYPNGLAVAKDGKIPVADSNNSRIQVFSAHGRSLRIIKKKLALPKGVAIDGLQRMHVADVLSHKIFVFDLGGRFLWSYGMMSKEESLVAPCGIAMDKKARKIIIADRGRNCVTVWKY